jgi:hypothetical protein
MVSEMVEENASGSSLSHSSDQCKLPLQKDKKEDVSIAKFKEEIAMGQPKQENVEEDANENRTWSLDSDSFKKVEASSQIGNNVKGILKRRVRFTE